MSNNKLDPVQPSDCWGENMFLFNARVKSGLICIQTMIYLCVLELALLWKHKQLGWQYGRECSSERPESLEEESRARMTGWETQRYNTRANKSRSKHKPELFVFIIHMPSLLIHMDILICLSKLQSCTWVCLFWCNSLTIQTKNVAFLFCFTFQFWSPNVEPIQTIRGQRSVEPDRKNLVRFGVFAVCGPK